MSYLDRLLALANSEKQPPDELTKPTKAPSVSFVSSPTGHFQEIAADSEPILPPPWDAIRDRIQAGWRAEFGPPYAEGGQVIIWREPGTWPRGTHQGEPAVIPRPEANPATTGTQEAGAGASGPVRCGDCRHQQPTGHPALIRCRAGVDPGAACGLRWKTDPHGCARFEPEPGSTPREAPCSKS